MIPGGPPDMGEHQAADSVAAGGLGHRRHVQVAADPAGEPDRPLPAGGLGEHQPGAARPGRELQELRRPHHRPLGRLDQVAEGRMAGVDHRPGVDPQLSPLEAPGAKAQAPLGG